MSKKDKKEKRLRDKDELGDDHELLDKKKKKKKSKDERKDKKLKKKKRKDKEVLSAVEAQFAPSLPVPPPPAPLVEPPRKSRRHRKDPAELNYGFSREEIENMSGPELVSLPMILLGNAYMAMVAAAYDEGYVPPLDPKRQAKHEADQEAKCNLNKKWTTEEDLQLVALKGAGVGFAAIGKELKRTGRACKTRFHTVLQKPATTFFDKKDDEAAADDDDTSDSDDSDSDDSSESD